MMEDQPRTIQFHFIKSNSYRVVHADGAYGGITPRQGIFVTFYSERLPIPTSLVHEIDSSGRLGPEIREKRESRDGVVREAEVGVSMDLEMAKSLLNWLREKIEVLEDMQLKAAKGTALGD